MVWGVVESVCGVLVLVLSPEYDALRQALKAMCQIHERKVAPGSTHYPSINICVCYWCFS
jgi:hypothetical protein